MWWSDKIKISDYRPFDMLPELADWVLCGNSMDWKDRVTFALEAQEALSYAYDEYRDVVRPIRVGVDPSTGQVFVIRDSAKWGCYVAAPSEIKFVTKA